MGSAMLVGSFVQDGVRFAPEPAASPPHAAFRWTVRRANYQHIVDFQQNHAELENIFLLCRHPLRPICSMGKDVVGQTVSEIKERAGMKHQHVTCCESRKTVLLKMGDVCPSMKLSGVRPLRNPMMWLQYETDCPRPLRPIMTQVSPRFPVKLTPSSNGRRKLLLTSRNSNYSKPGSPLIWPSSPADDRNFAKRAVPRIRWRRRNPPTVFIFQENNRPALSIASSPLRSTTSISAVMAWGILRPHPFKKNALQLFRAVLRQQAQAVPAPAPTSGPRLPHRSERPLARYDNHSDKKKAMSQPTTNSIAPTPLS